MYAVSVHLKILTNHTARERLRWAFLSLLLIKKFNLDYICINGPIDQSAERDANNAKVMSSRVIRTRFHFLRELFSGFT